MSKVLYHVTMSLDGFIAGPRDDMSWMAGLGGGSDPVVDDLLPKFGALLMGHNTYQPATAAGGEAYGGAWHGPIFVLTHDNPAKADEGFVFVSGDIVEVVERIKPAGDDEYLVLLGANVARQCLEAGVLDEVLVHVAPILLGDGVRLFEHPGGRTVQLEPISLTTPGRFMSIWARIVPGTA